MNVKYVKKIETVYSEDPNVKLNANNAVVKGILCSGNGYAQLNEIFSTLNMPNMNKSTYTYIEQCMTPLIEECAIDEMIAAGQEEKRLAILNGEIDKEGYPVITVIADGSWAKRSYKSGFSSASGTGCIVGLRTKRYYFLAFATHTVVYVLMSQRLKVDVVEHRCFKNWRDSAFIKSLVMHGVKYNKLIGDGDSSIMKKLLTKRYLRS